VKRVRIGQNYVANVEALIPFLRGDRMAKVVETAGEAIAERARQIAPVDTGAYRDGITVVVDRHPTRVAAHVGSTDRKSILVETKAHVMRRALG
jgi:uncharacterized protein YcbX